ncbi:MAG: DUF1566 domain-containing protein [Methylococcaceae bacterium]
MLHLTKIMSVLGLLVVLPLPGSAQTCKTSSISATTPTAQFADNRNGTVTDTKTGLMWKRCSEGQLWDDVTSMCVSRYAYYSWQTALQRAQDTNVRGGFAGLVGWRVPNSKELGSLVEEQCYSPAINLAVFPGTPENGFFWSSSLHAGSGGGLRVDFGGRSDAIDGAVSKQAGMLGGCPRIGLLI